jgi:DNA-binding transcriptional LysR family regulator
MELARLEAFLEVVRLGSVRAAARSLHLGQPALSARITGLEQDVGARVFERTKRGMVLTRAGRALLPHAERAVEAAEAGRSAVQHVGQGDEGELVIGAAAAVNASVVPELVARFRRFHPGVHLFVRTGSVEDIVELVTLGSAQIGLVRGSRDPHLLSTPLYDEEIQLMARPEHPFVIEGRIAPRRLADATLILFDRTSDEYEVAQSILKAEKVTPYGVIEVDSVDTARRLVTRGLGVAMLPSTAVAADVEAGQLARVELLGVPPIWRRTIAVERPEQSSWAPVLTMRELLAQVPTFVPGTSAVAKSG